MIERKGLLKIGDQDVTIIGEDVQVGQAAPDFLVHSLEWKLVHGLNDTAGKVRILAAVPSLDTPVCDREARRFNQEAAALDKDIVIEVISTDLPFAQKRWCGAAGVDQVMVLSDHLYTDFGQKYGCLIKERRILRRAVFVVNRQGIVTYVAYMPALGVEPNYEEVLQAARDALRAGSPT